MNPRLFNRVSLVLTSLNMAIIFLVVVGVLAAVYGITASRLRQAEEDDVALRASSIMQALSASEFEGEHLENDLDLDDIDAWIFDSRGTPVGFPSSPISGLPLPDDVSAALDGEETMRRVESDGAASIVVTRPVFHEERVVGAVQSYGEDESGQALRALMLALVAAGIGGLVVAAGAGYALSRVAMRPVRAAFNRQRAFVADASHELRTPIAIIQADADAVGRLAPGLSDDDTRLLDDLQQEAAFAGRTVARLLDLARLDAGESPISVEPTDIAALALEVASVMRTLASNAGVALECEVNETTVMAHADADRLRLALMAAIDNAIKYSRQGGNILVRVTSSNHTVTIEVQDDGEGIPREQQAKVFDRFFRVDKSRSRATGGAGLGLPLMKESVVAMGGNVSLESEPGIGTTVRISLRAA